MSVINPGARAHRHHTLGLIVLAVAALAICGTTSARTLQSVLNHGTIRVGVALYSPWAMRDGDSKLSGFEVDVIKSLASDMGVQPQIIAYDWKQLIPALQSGEIDLIAAGMTITPERALQVNFSQPYESGGIALATRIETTSKAKTLADLNSAQYQFAVLKDSVAEQLAHRLLPQAHVVTFKSVAEAADALIAGKLDGFLGQQPAPRFIALEHPGKIDLPLGRPLLETRAAFAVGKGDPDFVFYLNAWITAREADTWLPSTWHYWFETLRWRGDDARGTR